MGNPTVPLTSVFQHIGQLIFQSADRFFRIFRSPCVFGFIIGVFFFVDCAGNQVFVKAGLKLQRLRQLPLIGCDVGSVFIRQRLVDAALVDAVQNEVLGDINENHINEARAYHKAKKPGWVKWGAIAACLCLMVPLTAFAIDTIQYNAAVDYLNSLGIPVEDLGDYSHKEIKEAVKTIDAGESSPLTEEILNLLPGNEEQIDVPTQVTSEQIRELEPAMTREEVLSLLGNTQDIGSGIYIYVYEVDGEYLLHIPFASDGAQLGVTGEDLLKALTPISGDIGSNGTIEFNGQSFSKSDLTEETLEWLEWYNSLSPEEQLAVSSIPADLYTDDGAGTLDSNAEE